MGNSVVTIGARHVKVWRVEQAQIALLPKGPLDLASSTTAPPGSPGPKTFSGRNCLLGPLLDATFTCVVTITDSKAILCTSQGDVCLLDDSDKSQKLEKLASMDFGIQCAYFDEGRKLVWVAGKDQKMRGLSLENLTSSEKVPNLSVPSSNLVPPAVPGSTEIPSMLAIGSVRGCIVTSDSERNIKITSVERDREVYHLGEKIKHLPAHESAVLGVCELLQTSDSDEPKFLTYSSKGTVLFWLLDGACSGRIDIRLDQTEGAEPGDMNELKVVTTSKVNDLLYSGDKNGVLR